MDWAVTNLAWGTEAEGAAISALRAARLRKIEVAPGRLFADPGAVWLAEAERVRSHWAEAGLEIVSLQALLFSQRDLSIFGPRGGADCLQYLGRMAQLAEWLGAGVLVFGAGPNRSRGELAYGAALEQAVRFFRQLGPVAEKYGVTFAIEPIPLTHGADFLQSHEECAVLIEAIAHPAIRLALDLGAVRTNGENASRVIHTYRQILAHVHASEPGLLPLDEHNAQHAAAALALHEIGYQGIVTLECLAPATGHPTLPEILATFTGLYRS